MHSHFSRDLGTYRERCSNEYPAGSFDEISGVFFFFFNHSGDTGGRSWEPIGLGYIDLYLPEFQSFELTGS